MAIAAVEIAGVLAEHGLGIALCASALGFAALGLAERVGGNSAVDVATLIAIFGFAAFTLLLGVGVHERAEKRRHRTDARTASQEPPD